MYDFEPIIIIATNILSAILISIVALVVGLGVGHFLGLAILALWSSITG